MDALEPFPLFKSVTGLEVPSGERCHNDTALLHNNTCRQTQLSHTVCMLMFWGDRESDRCAGKTMTIMEGHLWLL